MIVCACLEYQVPEEKKTDVNMAVNVLEDAFRGLTDSMVIVSATPILNPPSNGCAGIIRR